MTTVVQTTVETNLRDRAELILKEYGMTVEDAVSALLIRVTKDQEFIHELRMPSAETLEAIAELERGEGTRYSSTAEMFAEIDNW